MIDQEKDENGNTLTPNEIVYLKNRISAQNSRVQKKLELSILQDKVVTIGNNLNRLIEALNRNVNKQDKRKVEQELLEVIQDQDFLKGVPEVGRFSAVLTKSMNFD